ncbi:Hypothetical predicted protein, partial [Paramuricea clavata]
MLMSRKPRSRLDVLHPDARQRVQNQQKKQKELHDQHAVDRQLRPGDLLEDDRAVHRHQDQISTSNPFQTNKWLAKKMQFQQPDIRKEIDRHRTIIRTLVLIQGKRSITSG